MKIDNRKDYLLLMLYSPGEGGMLNEPVVGRTRLVKMLFLFKQEVLQRFKKGDESQVSFYEFFPWHFGPFSRQVYDDIKFFQLRGFISTREVGRETTLESVAEWEFLSELEDGDDVTYTEYVEEEFTLSSKGFDFSGKLYSELSRHQKEVLAEFKARTSKAPLRALLKYVYSRYPEFTTKSQIRGEVLGEA